MRSLRYIFIGLIFSLQWFLSHPLYAQSYYLNGSAMALGGDCYAVTPADSWQNGSIWYARQLDLGSVIDLEFILNFGSNDEFGADGMVLVLQTAGTNALGINGSGIGFEGFNPAIGIEFDVFRNGENNDPDYDHMAILSNGNVHHGRSGNLAGPVPVLSNSGNIEDGNDHRVRLQWDPYTQTLSVWFDCSKRISLKKDLIKDIFRDQSLVYWGFTGATGKYFNLFKACLDPEIAPRYRDTICPGDSVQLVSRPSAGQSWLWTPSTGLNNPNVQSPMASPVTSTRYSVQYTNQCNETITDTFFVQVREAEGILPKDTFFCEGQSIRIDASTFAADSIRWQDNRTEMLRSLSDTGIWGFQWHQQGCRYEHLFHLSSKVPPTLQLNDTSVCFGDSIFIHLDTLSGRYDSYSWMDGSPDLSRVIRTSGNYALTLYHVCGDVTDQLHLSYWPADTFNLLTSDSLLCPGATVIVYATPSPGGGIIWGNGSQDDSIFVTRAGWQNAYSLSAVHRCRFDDSIYIPEGQFPEVSLEPEYVICMNEKIKIRAQSQNALVFYWNNTLGIDQFEAENYDGPLWIKAENDCGADSALTLVRTIDCECRLWFPNAFTPNTDQLNDDFRPQGDCKLLSFQWWIYNRWGELIYSGTDPESGWNGQINGRNAPVGTYFYRAEYEGVTNLGKERFQRAAIFHLLR